MNITKEPRKGYSMPMTEELRRMLDERGVEWADIDTGSRRSLITLWHGTGGMEWQFYENTKTNWTLLKSRRDYLTPEQAIDFTLSCGMLTADNVRDLIERHSDAYGGNGRDFHNGAYVAIADELNATLGDVPSLPHWWTYDGTLHVELPKLPDSISVRLPAQRDREVGSARAWQYTRDRGTCKLTMDGTDGCFGCSECLENIPPLANYCPNCGRKVVDG